MAESYNPENTVTESPETLRLIENSALFHGIPREVLDPLFAKARRVTLTIGERLLSPGKINENVYILISGRLSVQVSPATSDKPIALLGPGECVGEMSVLVDGLVSAYVIASTHCELYAIDYAAFWSLIDGSSAAARNMLNVLVKRIRLGNEVMADSLLHHESLKGNDIIDNLTGLYNYHGIRGKFDRLLQRCAVGKQPLSLIVLEVDDYEKPEPGEEMAGDHPLRAIAQTILNFLRPDDHSARLIGKKFAVLLAGIPLADALATAERLRTTISKTPVVLPNGKSLEPVTISAGVSEALPQDTLGTLVARADIGLEKAIASGRNRVTGI